jgi:hypothetical protein
MCFTDTCYLALHPKPTTAHIYTRREVTQGFGLVGFS